MLRHLSIAIAFLVLVAACGIADSTETTTTSASPATTVTTSVATTTVTTAVPVDSTANTIVTAELTVNLTSCDSADDFAILCEAYDYLKANFVDELDDSVLAAGAAQGIEDFVEGASGTSGLSSVACPLPSGEFELTCNAAAQALSTFETTAETVAEAAVAGLFFHGLDDPNSTYLPPEVLARISEEQTGTISGIGSLVVTEEETEGDERQRCNIISATCRMYIVSVI